MAHNFPVLQLDLGPEPNIVKPLQNQVPDYPLVLPNELVPPWLACLASSYTPSTSLLGKHLSADHRAPTFFRSPQLKVSMSSCLQVQATEQLCVLHISFTIPCFPPSFALLSLLLDLYSYWFTAFSPLHPAVILHIQIPSSQHPFVQSILPPLSVRMQTLSQIKLISLYLGYNIVEKEGTYFADV